MQIVPNTMNFLRLFSPVWSKLTASVSSTGFSEDWPLLSAASDALAAAVKALETSAQLVALEDNRATDVLR